ncbi:MAG: 30S ribosome-binding factor RbfA [Cyclobacteriaceae bacterium]
MESKRQIKVARLIQKELGEIFQRDAKSMFVGKIITVTRAAVSPDLGVAKVWLSFLNSNDHKASLEQLEVRKKEIRFMLGNKVSQQLRRVPELIFVLDDGAEYASKINDIIKNLDIPPAPEDTDKEE